MKRSSLLKLFALAVAATSHAEEKSLTATIEGHVFRPVQLQPTDERMAALKVAEGFTITVFARDLKEPRMMAVTADGRVYVTRRGEQGEVLLLVDKDGDGLAEPPRSVLKVPHVHGIAIKEDTVYLSAVREVYSAPIHSDGSFGDLKKLYGDLPDAGQHPNRTLRFGPSGTLYLSVGSTCNAALEPNPESATLLELKTDGTGRKIYAKGLRNTIGFDWHPGTLKLYGMDHGIDWLGDDSQQEELNELKPGKNYGWPFVIESGKPNPASDPKEAVGMTWEQYAATCEPALLGLTAHSAPMALLFPSTKHFPSTFADDALVTLHGSWNRGEPSGYKVVRLRFEKDQPVKFEDFVTGFYLEGEKGQFGRPCGLAEWNDGTILMSDDAGGVIYRIWHPEDKTPAE